MNGKRQAAFTLIEMLVVLALSAILASIVAFSLTGSYRTATAEDVAGRIANYDRLAREYSRRFGRPVRLVFNLGRDTVTRAPGETSEISRDNIGGVLHLPSAFRLDRVATGGGTATSGQASINCSPDGQTPSYAVRLTDVRGTHHWMLMAGLTGKTLQVRDEQEIQDIFRTIGGADAAPSIASNDAR